MKKTNYILILMMLISAFSVYSLTCGFQNPTASNNNNLTAILNMSYATQGDNAVISGAFYIISGGNTRNTTSILLANRTNYTSAPTWVNFTIPDSVVLDDGNDYTLSCVCTNSTNTENCNSTRTVLWNKNVPTAPTSITFTNPVLDTNTITATINRINANRCWIKFGGNSRQAMTLSGTTCTYTVTQNNPVNSDYETTFSADDSIDAEAVSTVQYITIRAVASSGNIAGTITIDESQQGTNGQAFVNPFTSGNEDSKKKAALVILLLIGAAFLFKKK